jgi:hypothetical protein
MIYQPRTADNLIVFMLVAGEGMAYALTLTLSQRERKYAALEPGAFGYISHPRCYKIC